MAKINNLTIMVEHTGKRIPVETLESSVTAQELLDALTSKINLPVGTNAVLIRKITRKQLLPHQALGDAGVEDDETLIADFERTAGSYV